MSMSVSLKKATNKTNIRHNNRTMSEKEKEQNSHIDYSRSDENKYLVQKDLKKLYREEFGEVLENYNAKQKRNDRKIDDYYKHIQSSKKTSLQQEMIIQVGDKDDFSSKQDFEKANEILEEWLLGFEKRNPNLKIYNAVIHNDEASPHMHLNFVPVASGYKRGLEKQVSFDRAITQQDPKLDKTRPFDDWREKEVKILEEMLKERGIERKLVGSNNYKDVNEYKEKKDLEKEILSLENQLFEKKNELLEMSERLPGEIKIKAEREKKTEVVNKGFLKKEKVEKPTGNWIVETKELKRVQGIINAGYSVKKDYDRLQRMDLVKENKELCDKVDSLAEGYVKAINENTDLENENRELRKEISSLKAHIRDLKENVKVLYHNTKKLLGRQFEGFRGLIKNELDMKGIDNQFEREHKKEMKTKQRGYDMER
ncbi:plasmid recombination protein [Bacillus paranthracis]|uniref:Plasmid recombination protein n=7 Tax=Bacteria TaxID=2 RepID=A0ABY9JNZ5_9ACTN|nr:MULTISPECIES: plasmid recombination protein [Terrabacteria group]KAB7629347.1 plasmid recombination protein [Bacillus sp. B4-WWTP-NA-D-NA-NA]KMP82062.1 Mob protein [Bacillus cereus]MRA63918.1 plasmid recombination protein [Bacillus thuringiensis]OUB93989.1 plasmid recombination enzyme [Bacillus thuringiensis serovar canadensis]KXI45264.1 Mob protein [Bacillus cereus]